MRTRQIILFLLVFFPLRIFGQDTIPVPQTGTVTDTVFPPDSINRIEDETVMLRDSSASRDMSVFAPAASAIDTTQKISFWTITPQTGEMIPAIPDTTLTDYFNRTNAEGLGVSVAYLGNLGLPMESRVFFEREDRSEFMFFDPFWAYAKRPDKFQFVNTKIPYTNISYQTAGGRQGKEERFQAFLAVNLGKKLNVGFDVDYLYARGVYNSQAAKHTDWVFFSNYLSDRYRLHLFINPSSYANAENGGLVNDDWISHPELLDTRSSQPRDFSTKFSNTWNYQKGSRYFLNYRYNLGFEKDSTFIPVSSIIYTFDYTGKSRRFYSEDTAHVNAIYNNEDFLNPLRPDKLTNDSTSYFSLKNTFALSLREGFSNWAKFDLTAFITHDIRKFTMMDTTIVNPGDSILTFQSKKENRSSTYIGGELAKRTGKILRYNAYGSFGVLGDNIADMNLSGRIETRIPFLKDTASISAYGSWKYLSPTYYENHYISRYLKWDIAFAKIEKMRIGGEINFPQTQTKLGIDVENVKNYIYFDKNGYPRQHKDNIQILAATLQQNFKLGGLHWDNQAVYQLSGNDTVIPLPSLSVYSNLYLQFKIAGVLTIQMGVNAHYWTKYKSPTYDPATQQFKLQDEANRIEVGNYPLINGYVNCHLKQTRFFIEYYNLGARFINPPEYFSMPHYPVNPTQVRMGLSVDWMN